MATAHTSRHGRGKSHRVPAPPAAAPPASPPRGVIVSRDGVAAWGQADAARARSGFSLRRMRYFQDLLIEGFKASQSVERLSGTMRSERVALAIDRPELDAVELWSARRDDGSVAIPFVEYILGQFIVSLETFLADLGDPGADAEVATLATALDLALKEANRRGEQAVKVPQLGDSFLPGPLLERLCGREGLLPRTVRRCEELLVEVR